MGVGGVGENKVAVGLVGRQHGVIAEDDLLLLGLRLDQRNLLAT